MEEHGPGERALKVVAGILAYAGLVLVLGVLIGKWLKGRNKQQ